MNIIGSHAIWHFRHVWLEYNISKVHRQKTKANSWGSLEVDNSQRRWITRPIFLRDGPNVVGFWTIFHYLDKEAGVLISRDFVQNHSCLLRTKQTLLSEAKSKVWCQLLSPPPPLSETSPQCSWPHVSVKGTKDLGAPTRTIFKKLKPQKYICTVVRLWT